MNRYLVLLLGAFLVFGGCNNILNDDNDTITITNPGGTNGEEEVSLTLDWTEKSRDCHLLSFLYSLEARVNGSDNDPDYMVVDWGDNTTEEIKYGSPLRMEHLYRGCSLTSESLEGFEVSVMVKLLDGTSVYADDRIYPCNRCD